MVAVRTTKPLEMLIELIVRKHGARDRLVEVVLDNGERFGVSEILGNTRTYVCFEVLGTETKPMPTSRIVPVRRIRCVNVYTDPGNLPEAYTGSRTVGFESHRKGTMPEAGPAEPR